MSKLFVILEVKDTTDREYSGLMGRFIPADTESLSGEYMWLNLSRIIPASRLRWEKPKRGEMMFDLAEPNLWRKATIDFENCVNLILDPEPEEKDEWDEWTKTCPLDDWHTKTIQKLVNWLKRMPRR